MTTEQIDKFLGNGYVDRIPVKISFRTRKPIVGLFVSTEDFNELKSKNFWRIVWESHFEQYNESKDLKQARIFSGTDFTKLSPV